MTDDERDGGGERSRAMTPPRPFDADPEQAPLALPPEPEQAEEPAGAAPAVIEQRAAPAAGAPFENLAELPALLEALLFVADHPIEEPYLTRALEVTAGRLERALEALATVLREGQRGIRLQRGPAGVQLVSAPQAAAKVEYFLGLEATRRLSTAALETLAIVAYRQPVTRGQIDAIRGVSSDAAVATLRARELIAPAGYAPGPGRPVLFQTTQRFLEHFGLERAGQLPPLPEGIDLPPAEIGAQLGLNDETVAAALAMPAAPADRAEHVAGADHADVEISADVTALTEAAEHALAAAHGSAARPTEETADRTS